MIALALAILTPFMTVRNREPAPMPLPGGFIVMPLTSIAPFVNPEDLSQKSTNIIYDARYRLDLSDAGIGAPQYKVSVPTNTFVDSVRYYGANELTDGGLLLWSQSETGQLQVVYSEIGGTRKRGVCIEADMGYSHTSDSTNFTLLEFTNHAGLPHKVWTNLPPPGKSTQLWQTYPSASPGSDYYRTNDPVMTRREDCIISSAHGLTGISQFNNISLGGQLPFTLLTKRHAYFRGHSTGLIPSNEGTVVTNNAGDRVFFVSASNVVVGMTISNRIGRITGGRDYNIVSFTQDVPAYIHPMYVMAFTNVQRFYSDSSLRAPFPFRVPVWLTEQGGNCFISGSTDYDGNWFKGGDSGAPNFLNVPTGASNTLVFYAGRTTSGPDPQMQADIDALTLSQGLNTNNYQLNYFDLSSYPLLP